MSVCTYSDGLFQVMIVDEDTGQEIHFEGNKELTDEEFEMINKVAPACVWTPYQQL
jgi:hypothetical protein